MKEKKTCCYIFILVRNGIGGVVNENCFPELQNVKLFTQINSFQMNLPQEKVRILLQIVDLKCMKWAKKSNFRVKLPKMISLRLF